MPRLRPFAVAAALLAAALLLVALPSREAAAGLPKLPGKLKEKVQKKVEQKAEQKVDEKIDGALEGGEGEAAGDEAAAPEAQGGEAEEAGGAQPQAGGAAPAPAAAGAAADMTLYTKYDFVPGDRVIFYDDQASDEMGEFPHRWRLDNGVFEIAKFAGEPWILNTDEGSIRPDIPDGLPERYTVEVEIWSAGPAKKGHWYSILWVDGDGRDVGEFILTDGVNTRLSIEHVEKASKQLPAELAPGKHVLRVMATSTSVKCYVDHERVANVPKVAGWTPAGLRLKMDPWQDEAGNPMLARAFRFAEGGKTLKDQLAETGRIVTHGILFDSGSAVIRGESYKTLSLIAELLAGDPALRLSIEGHTDSDGADADNLALSQKRADAVKAWLTAQGTAADRLQTRGLGETKPIDTNATPEGKANNRRVELVRL